MEKEAVENSGYLIRGVQIANRRKGKKERSRVLGEKNSSSGDSRVRRQRTNQIGPDVTTSGGRENISRSRKGPTKSIRIEGQK